MCIRDRIQPEQDLVSMSHMLMIELYVRDTSQYPDFFGHDNTNRSVQIKTETSVTIDLPPRMPEMTAIHMHRPTPDPSCSRSVLLQIRPTPDHSIVHSASTLYVQFQYLEIRATPLPR